MSPEDLEHIYFEVSLLDLMERERHDVSWILCFMYYFQYTFENNVQKQQKQHYDLGVWPLKETCEYVFCVQDFM